MAEPDAGQGGNGVGHRAASDRHPDLADAGRTRIRLHQPDKNFLGRIGHAHHFVIVKIALLYPALFEGYALGQDRT